MATGISVSKLIIYSVVSIPVGIGVSKSILHTVVTVPKGVGISKSNWYSAITVPKGLNSSKFIVYSVKDACIMVSKVNLYSVITGTSIPQFPDLPPPNYSLLEMPSFDTTILPYGNRVEQRINKQGKPRWTFNLTWDSLSNKDKNTLEQFYIARKGAYEKFVWNHPAPSEVIGTDGFNYSCILSHKADNSNKPITGANYDLYWKKNGIDGILWALDSIYKRNFMVRFKIDSNNFIYFEYNLWQFNNIELIEV